MQKLIWTIITILAGIIIFFSINFVLFMRSNSQISSGDMIPEYSGDTAILLVVDIQEGTTGKVSIDHAYQNKASSLFYSLNNLIAEADKRNMQVVYIFNEITNPVINLFNTAMKKGAPGTKLDDRLDIASNHIFSKSKQDAFSNPAFEKFLTDNKINRIYITGLDAGYCVRSTALAALNRNYQVILIEDAIISKSEQLKDDSFQELSDKGVRIIQDDQF
ncbi:MAG: cysteine hydrolase family protein [Fidelibacterota bacterium]